MEQRIFWGANLALILWLGLASTMLILPAEQKEKAQSLLRDAVVPGLVCVEGIRNLLSSATSQADQPEQESDISPTALETQNRLLREIAALKDQLDREKRQRWQALRTASLFQPELVTARELISAQQERWQNSRWIDAGSKKSVSEESWVLKSELPLLDVGSDYKLEEDLLLLSGRQVLGQIDQVGRWSSTYRPLTHDQFRCPALVMNRQTGLRNEQSAGSLHGTGQPHCELKYIENTHPVNVGDLVVLADPERRFDSPLILGTVSSARVLSNSPFWEIEVAPAQNSEPTRQVYVLTERLNASRLGSQ